MFNQKAIIILFIDRNRFQIFGGNLTNIVTLEIPEVIVRDIDVVQKDAFYTLIKQWVKQYALAGAQIVMIFSGGTYFEKIFLTAQHEQIETEILKFFDTVPFESIWTKVYPVEKGKRAIAVNKTLYETIHQGFSLQGLPTKAVIPSFALGPLAGKKVLDQELAQYIIKNVEILTKQSLLDVQELGLISPTVTEEKPVTVKKSTNLPLLLGVFGVLIVILIIVVVVNLR